MEIRLQHVTIPRPPASTAAARKFYGELLDLPELLPGDDEDGEPLLRFGVGDAEIQLSVEPPLGQDRSARHFCLAVDELEMLRVRLEAAGVAVVGAPPVSSRQSYFIRDPFGNLIEIAAQTSGPA